MGRPSNRVGLLRDLVAFARQEKKYWIIPLAFLLLLVGLLIVVSYTASPFVYTLF